MGSCVGLEMTLRFKVTLLAPGVHLVRLLEGEGYSYKRLIVVTEIDEGSVLFLSGLSGKPLSPREWREGRDRLFPAARVICYWRIHPKTGVKRWVSLCLGPPAFYMRPSPDLAAA